MSEEKTPWNPSKKATARVKDKLPAPCECRYCQGEVTIEKNSKIYRGKEYGEWPWIYYCNSCGASVGLHPFTNIPLGTLADTKLRKERNKVKANFHLYMETKSVSRSQAYQDLADMLDIPKSECHFGWFDTDDLVKANTALQDLVDGKRPVNKDSPFAQLAGYFKK
jgi:hypothetical protein